MLLSNNRWPNYYTVCCWLAILATAWLLVIFLDVFVIIRKVSLEVRFCLNTFRYSYFYFPINIWSGSHSAVFANLWYSVTKFWILYQNASQKFTTSWTVFVGRWTHLKNEKPELAKKRSRVQLLPDYTQYTGRDGNVISCKTCNA